MWQSIACGEMVRPAFAAAKLLEEQGISATVLDMYCVKPLDTEGVIKAAKECKGSDHGRRARVHLVDWVLWLHRLLVLTARRKC